MRGGPGARGGPGDGGCGGGGGGACASALPPRQRNRTAECSRLFCWVCGFIASTGTARCFKRPSGVREGALHATYLGLLVRGFSVGPLSGRRHRRRAA